MSKHNAYEMQKFTTKPARSGLFYACARWAAIVFLLSAIGNLLAGCDDLQAAHAMEAERVADQQDREALSSREWAGQQVCGPHATAVWTGDKEMQCFKHTRLVHGDGK